MSRLAHPGGPMTTNKAAALAKFLERKLQQPDGLSSINPDLLELAVKNAKETVKASNGKVNFFMFLSVSLAMQQLDMLGWVKCVSC